MNGRLNLINLLFVAFLATVSCQEHNHHDMASVAEAAVIKSRYAGMDLTTRRDSSLTPNFCMASYVMDTFCIDRGTFLDKPTVKSLQYPEQHTVFCLIDVPMCVASGYEVLSPPTTAGGVYGRAVRLDSMGTAMFLSLATLLGNCTTCNGTIAEGLKVTVIGYLANNLTSSNGTPPELQTISVLPVSVGCKNFTSATMTMSTSNSAPVTSPTTKSSDASSFVSPRRLLVGAVMMIAGLLMV